MWSVRNDTGIVVSLFAYFITSLYGYKGLQGMIESIGRGGPVFSCGNTSEIPFLSFKCCAYGFRTRVFGGKSG